MAEAPPPRGDGLYGPKFPGKPLNMVDPRRLLGRRVRRAPSPGDARRAARHRRVPPPAPPGPAAPARRGRLDVGRPALPGGRRPGVRPRGGGHPDRRQRRHPRVGARRGRATPRRRGPPAARGRAARWSSAPARTSARSSRSSRRCAGWPARGAASWPPRRRSRWSRPAGARCRSATCSAPVRGRPGPDVQLGPLPPVGRGLRPGGRGHDADPDGRARRGRPRRRRPAPTACAACRRPRTRRSARPAPRSARPRSTAASADRPGAGRELRRHPWFGEQRFWFGHKPPASSPSTAPVPSSRSAPRRRRVDDRREARHDGAGGTHR